MASPFFQAAYCQPPTVLGRRLQPFSLSHVYLLQGLENGFAVRGDGRRSELFAAVLICSRGHAENARALFGGGLPFWRLFWWSCRWSRKRIRHEADKFRQYLSDYCETPEHWSDGEDRPYLAPWQFHFVHTLCSEYGCTLDEAWDMPVSLARCYQDVFDEFRGDKSLVSEDEAGKIRFLNEETAQ